MALAVNLLRRETPPHAGRRDRARTRQRVYLAILILSGLMGAGAAVELLGVPSDAPE